MQAKGEDGCAQRNREQALQLAIDSFGLHRGRPPIEKGLSSFLLSVNMEKEKAERSVKKFMSKRSMHEMQKEVDLYISQFKEGYFSPLSMLARMTEEVGELAREVNHQFGEKPKKATEQENSIELELGDILFITICFANSQGIDLTEAFDKVMHKFNTRDANRWTPKESAHTESV